MSTAETMDGAGVPLEGRLGDPATLPRLFAWLSRGDWSGLVRVQSGDAERRVYFVDGRVSTAGSTDPQESLASHLIREGLLSEEDRSRAAGQLRTPDRGWSFGKQLVRAGLLQDKDVGRVERRRVVQLAESVLGLRSGTYACEPGQLAGDAQPQQGLEVPRLVAEGVLTLWDANSALEALGGHEAILDMVAERLPDHEATGAEEAYDYTLLLCDGRRTVREVIAASPLPEAASLRFLAALRLLDIVSSRPGASAPQASAPPPPPAGLPAEPSVATGPVEAAASVARDSEPGAPPPGPPAPAPDASVAQTAPPPRPKAPPPPRVASPAGTRAVAQRAPEGGARTGGASRMPWVLLIVLILAAATAFFFWVGWRRLALPEPAPEPVATAPPASGEAWPPSGEPSATAPIAPPEAPAPATEPPLPVPGQP